MANFNLSDMYSRQLLQSALRSLTASGGSAMPRSSLTLAQIMNLSTFDRPAAATLQENAYYQKYKEKLEKIRQSRPEDYEAAMNKIFGDKSTEMQKDLKDVKNSSVLSKMQASSKSSKPLDSSSAKTHQRKTLDSIIKLDLLEDKCASEITQIWNQYYAKKDRVVFACIPAEKYNRLKEKGKQFPTYVYPIPRESGYEFILGQCSGDDWYYTPLLAYQTHNEYAPYCLAVHHYTELAESKGIVLMVGEIATDDMKAELATLLVHETQLMYGSDENIGLVKLMNETPDSFDHMEVVNVCKKAGLF